MKKQLLICLLLPILSFGQTQIGQDIDGEAAMDASGRAISLSSDGTIVAVGAVNNDENGSNSGHVRVYENINGDWIQIGQDINGEASVDASGSSVSLSSDGTIVAIGAVNNDGNGSISGHVRVYENINSDWIQIGQDIDGEASDDSSGSSVSLSSDGTIVAIGAINNDANGLSSGHVRVYENINSVWTQIGQDIDGDTGFDELGFSVSLSDNGSVVAVGANRSNGNGEASGEVRMYNNVDGNWIQIGENIYGDAMFDFLGASVSLSSDGTIVAIGANQFLVNNSLAGYVQVYRNQGNNWIQIGQDIIGESGSDFFGSSVSLSSDGTIVAIGAFQNDGNEDNSGHARIYKNQNDTWVQVGEDIDGENANDSFGRSVSLSSDGSIVAIGAPGDDANGESSGHVRVFDLSSALSTKEVLEVSFKIYPNPASTNVTIQLDQNSSLEKATIYNTLGQIVKTSTETTIDTSDVSKGIYILEVTTNQGKASRKLMIE